jgi:hypothetical protein
MQAGAEWWYSEVIDALISSRSFFSRRLAEEIELLNSAGRLKRGKDAAQKKWSMRMFSLLANKFQADLNE